MTDTKAAGASPRCLRRIWHCATAHQFQISVIIAITQEVIEYLGLHSLYLLSDGAIMIAVIWFDALLCRAFHLFDEKPELFSTKRTLLIQVWLLFLFYKSSRNRMENPPCPKS